MVVVVVVVVVVAVVVAGLRAAQVAGVERRGVLAELPGPVQEAPVPRLVLV